MKTYLLLAIKRQKTSDDGLTCACVSVFKHDISCSTGQIYLKLKDKQNFLDVHLQPVITWSQSNLKWLLQSTHGRNKNGHNLVSFTIVLKLDVVVSVSPSQSIIVMLIKYFLKTSETTLIVC